MSHDTLPPQSPNLSAPFSDLERIHSQKLLALLRVELARTGGWLDFQQFMNLALYAPGLGYYSAGAHKLGEGGDFTTAPEISPLFSRCIARQCAQALQALGQGQGQSQGSVLELGAGSGVMALHLLRELDSLGCLPERYCILEVSADLRARQQTRLQPYLDRVQWLDAWPENFVGIIVANEVLDALPVQRFVIHQGVPQVLGVIDGAQGLQWQCRPASAKLLAAVRAIEHNLQRAFADNYCSEVNLQLPAWLQALATALHRGVVLCIDYGWPQAQYYSAERRHGTLSCFFRQRMHDDPLVNVGLQDITAWVDFTAVAEAGLAAGLELQGFATQAHFLLGAGLDQLLHDLSEQDDMQRWRLSQQVQKLTLPGEMGESFKAMAFTKNCDVSLSGFGIRDLRDRL